MSSLLQFNGDVSHKGVGLQFVKVKKDQGFTEDADVYLCPHCGKEHGRIAVAYRKPAGTLGPWVVFRYNGQEHVPDLSIPISVEELPRGAVTLSDSDSTIIWHS